MAATLGATSRSFLGSEFNEFLFAPIGEDRNGMLLTVVSALARLDLDPWQEATKLARLPGATATERLASLLATLPDRPSAHPDAGTMAARLIALLPGPTGSNVASRETPLRVGAVSNSRRALYVILINVIFMALLLGAQQLMASRQPPAQPDEAGAPGSDTVSPQIPTPSSGQ
jgi:hypothetical protein